MDEHQRTLIREAVIALLLGANTAAGARVSDTRVDPHKKGELPALSVYTLSESTDPESASTAPVELTRNLKLEIAGWVLHTAAVSAAKAADRLARQVETAIAANYWLTLAVTITAVDHTTGRLTIPAHGLETGASAVAIAAAVGGVVPTGLAPGLDYGAVVIDANTIQLASSRAAALDGAALSFSDNGTLPLRLLVGTVADQMLEATEIQVVEGDGQSDPLVGIVTLTYAITYRTSPAAPTGLGDFTTVDAKHQVAGGVPDTIPAEDTFTVQEIP